MTKNIQEKHSLINACHLNIGNKKNKVAFVFSCPGQSEEKAQKPVTGQTGKNLDALLVYLNKKNSTIFRDTDRYAYRITNAWDKVEFESRTGRTEARTKEIVDAKNVSRVKRELDGMDVVIFFGKKAQRIERLIDFSGIVLTVRHLSLQSINRMTESKEGIEKKLELLGNEILVQLDNICLLDRLQ